MNEHKKYEYKKRSAIQEEIFEMKQDTKKALRYFRKQLPMMFSSNGDRVVKIYVIFVLILLPFILAFLFGPFFSK